MGSILSNAGSLSFAQPRQLDDEVSQSSVFDGMALSPLAMPPALDMFVFLFRMQRPDNTSNGYILHWNLALVLYARQCVPRTALYSSTHRKHNLLIFTYWAESERVAETPVRTKATHSDSPGHASFTSPHAIRGSAKAFVAETPPAGVQSSYWRCLSESCTGDSL